jgi:two-component sensor histidine kinase
VTNSLKHAFGESGGLITVLLESRANEDMALVVADNGRGSSDDLSVKGLGTTLLQGFVSQIKAKLLVTWKEGTRTEILIPSGSVG